MGGKDGPEPGPSVRAVGLCKNVLLVTATSIPRILPTTRHIAMENLILEQNVTFHLSSLDLNYAVSTSRFT